MTSLIANELNTAFKSNEIITICLDATDADNFIAGTIDSISDDYVRVCSITPNGEQDGYIVFRYDTIVRIDRGGKYEKKLHFLKEKLKVRQHYILDSKKNINIMYSTLLSLHNKHETFQLWKGEDELPTTGFVHALDKENITIHAIDRYGTTDGYSTFKIDYIQVLECLSKDCCDLKLLAQEQE